MVEQFLVDLNNNYRYIEYLNGRNLEADLDKTTSDKYAYTFTSVAA